MKQVISATSILLLLGSMLSFLGFSLVHSAFAVGITPIVLPFATGFENTPTLDPHGRTAPFTTTSVDWKTSNFYGYSGSGSSPVLDIEDASVTPPEGYNLLDRQLAAKGYFGGSYSYCYFNLFDQDPASDYNPPIKLQRHTYISIWYCHVGVPCCMIDALLYNRATGQWSTLRGFNDGNGHYIVDQNYVRIHPADRRYDAVNQWKFSCFDLSMIYYNYPDEWYITKIWVGMDNDPSHGLALTGSAVTYFDNLHITYGEGATQSASLPGYGFGCTAQVTASIVADTWANGPVGSGTHILYLKCSIYSNSSGTYWYDNPTYSYLNVTGSLGGSAQPFRYGDGHTCINSANLTNTEATNPHNPDWLSFGVDATFLIASLMLGPEAPIGVVTMLMCLEVTTMIAQLVASSYQTNSNHYTYIWPQSVNMTNNGDPWPSGTYAGVYIGVSVPDGSGSFSLPIDLKSAFWYKYWDWYYRFVHDGDVSVHIDFPVNTNPSNPSSGSPSIVITTPYLGQHFGPTSTISVSATVVPPACYLLANQTLNDQSGYVFTRLTDTAGNPVKTYDWQVMQCSSGSTQSVSTGGTFTYDGFNLSGLSPNHYYFLYVKTLATNGQSCSNVVYIYDAQPIVTISPSSNTIYVGQSQAFTSTVTGGIPSYSYQWCLNGAAISGAINPTWTFTPSSTGSYTVYLNVTDSWGNVGKSNTASITVIAPPPPGGGGGCPYVYVWNGTNFIKDNNILPASETGNGTDAQDYYRLEQPLAPVFTTQQASLYTLQIREFESEIDYIDQVRLIAVDHSQDTNIAVTPEGEVLTYMTPNSPLSCIDNRGIDRLSATATMNGDVSDASTYFQGYKDDWLVLNFGKITEPYAKLILRDDQKCCDVCINVQVLDSTGNWQTVEVLHPRDFWSMEAVNMAAYVPKTGDFKIRLLWTTTHRLDYVGLDTSAPANVKLSSASPIQAVQSALGNVRALLLRDDGKCVKLVNGQQITMTFMLPNKTQDATRDFIFCTNGYYYTMTP